MTIWYLIFYYFLRVLIILGVSVCVISSLRIMLLVLKTIIILLLMIPNHKLGIKSVQTHFHFTNFDQTNNNKELYYVPLRVRNTILTPYL